jgi:hypothetical protein
MAEDLSRVTRSQEGDADSIVAQVFDTVWYLRAENRWRDLNVLAYREVGKLTVNAVSMEFMGKNEIILCWERPARLVWKAAKILRK